MKAVQVRTQLYWSQKFHLVFSRPCCSLESAILGSLRKARKNTGFWQKIKSLSQLFCDTFSSCFPYSCYLFSSCLQKLFSAVLLPSLPILNSPYFWHRLHPDSLHPFFEVTGISRVGTMFRSVSCCLLLISFSSSLACVQPLWEWPHFCVDCQRAADPQRSTPGC